MGLGLEGLADEENLEIVMVHEEEVKLGKVMEEDMRKRVEGYNRRSREGKRRG